MNTPGLSLSSFFFFQTCVIRAWDLSKPLLFCPAMNTSMWEHPITAKHMEQLKGFGYTEVPCIVKKLVCGDEGQSLQCPRTGVLGVFSQHSHGTGQIRICSR
uniref:Flavoprotein domain-containing protein n=1 Tax=Sphenodon punctatus TaxID=8508 RepID=A0A8D0GYV1_SPHPU